MNFPVTYPLEYNENDSLKTVFDRFPYPLDQIDYSIPINNTQKDGYSPIFRNKSSINGLLTNPNQKTTTIFELFEQNVQSFGNNKFLAWKSNPNDNYQFLTYKETQSIRNKLGSGILKLMEQFQKGKAPNDFILSTYSPNRYEWSLVDYTCHAFSITSTALYDTLGPDAINFVLQNTETSIIFLPSSKISTILSKNSSFLKIIVSFDPVDNDTKRQAQSKGVQLFTFQEIIEIGTQSPHQLIPPSPEQIFSITYTSGTSGIPKGVIITHANLLAAILTIYTKCPIEEHPKHFVFLPLAHILQRVNFFLVSIKGGEVYFPHNGSDVKSFFADILQCKPTHMALVPRVYNKIESMFKNKIYEVEENFGLKLTKWAIDHKLTKFGQKQDPGHWIYDRIIHNKLRKTLGFDEVKYFVSGAAPIHGETLQFIKALFNVHIFIEAYGSTESCGGVLMNSGHEVEPGFVGSVSPTTEFKTRDVPEMEYTFSQNRSGELLLRGPQIFKGYFKDPENTKEAFDDEGWYKTGDIVKVDKQGKVMIIDRYKNFFKLSQGEFIAPEKIENQYVSNNSDLISQIWCYGDSLKSFLVGIIGVDPENLKLFLDKNNINVNIEDESALKILFEDQEFKKLVLSKMNAKMVNLQGFEKLKNIHIDLEPLKIENGTLTPTLKVKRFIAKKVFHNEIEKLYNQGALITSNKL